MNRTSDLTRRLWAALLALCLTLSLALPVFAEGESDTEPEAKETYHIGTVDELLQLADYCRLDSWSKNRTVVLDTDLELTGSGFTGIPSFSGVFEGQGHVISGLSLVDDGSVIGFFRYVQKEANVRDLVVRGRAMPSGSRTTVGGLAGSNAGTLHNCRFEGVSSGASIVGGIFAGANAVMFWLRQTAVLAFQFGDSFTNVVTPTCATLMAALSMAKVPWGEMDQVPGSALRSVGSDNLCVPNFCGKGWIRTVLVSSRA